jgi:hypothetical protein
VNKDVYYECVKCKFNFWSSSGPHTCFKCGSAFIKWLNYEEWLKTHHVNLLDRRDNNDES